jgi:hypothetical protein
MSKFQDSATFGLECSGAHSHVINRFQQFVVPSAFGLWLFAEPFRLYCGYVGNLNEKVPQMSAFILISIFTQFPAIGYAGGLSIEFCAIFFGCKRRAFAVVVRISYDPSFSLGQDSQLDNDGFFGE